MKLSDMISHLSTLKGEVGDVEVLISDGHKFNFYRGNYDIRRYDSPSNQVYVDIAIGGCHDDEYN